MNTASENAYYELMSGDRIHFKVVETREVEYDFQITANIMVEFEKWKVDLLENADILPTELEILEYFKNLRVISCGPAGYGPKEEVVEIKIIEKDND